MLSKFQLVGMFYILQVTKYNYTDYVIDKFAEFIETATFLERKKSLATSSAAQDAEGEAGSGGGGAGGLVLTQEDMEGPVPTRAVAVTDYYLYLAWAFTIVCAVGYFAKSTYCQRFIESIRNNWREAEIQHEHID